MSSINDSSPLEQATPYVDLDLQRALVVLGDLDGEEEAPAHRGRAGGEHDDPIRLVVESISGIGDGCEDSSPRLKEVVTGREGHTARRFSLDHADVSAT